MHVLKICIKNVYKENKLIIKKNKKIINLQTLKFCEINEKKEEIHKSK